MHRLARQLVQVQEIGGCDLAKPVPRPGAISEFQQAKPGLVGQVPALHQQALFDEMAQQPVQGSAGLTDGLQYIREALRAVGHGYRLQHGHCLAKRAGAGGVPFHVVFFLLLHSHRFPRRYLDRVKALAR